MASEGRVMSTSGWGGIRESGSGTENGQDGGLRTTGIQTPHTMYLQLARGAETYRIQMTPSATQVRAIMGSNSRDTTTESSADMESATDHSVQLTFDFDNMAKPSFLGSIIGGRTEDLLRERVITEASLLFPRIYPHLGRAPTQEEAETIAMYTAAGIRSGSYGPFVGTTVMVAREVLSFRAGKWHLPLPFRLPGNYQRAKGFEPGVIRLASREILRGPAALLAQRSFRILAFASVGRFLGGLWDFYSVNRSLQEAANDPKLSEIKKAITSAATELRENAMQNIRGAGQRRASQGQGARPASSQKDMGQIWGDWRRQDQASGGKDPSSSNDDASPSAGGSMTDSMYAQPETVKEDRFARVSSESEQRSESGQFAENQNQARRGGQGRGPSGYNQAQPNESASQPGRNIDDFFSGSSSATTAEESSTSSLQNSTQASGSAWERLRRGGSAPQRRQTQNRQQDDASPVAEEQAGDAERTRAQREFDAMLEKERSGKGSDGMGRRW